MTPGIYTDMADEDYRAIKAVSKSDLDRWALGDSTINERAALIGTAFDAALLEPELASHKIVVCEHRRNSNAWKEVEEASGGAWVLARHEYNTIVGMRQSVMEHPDVSRWAQLARDSRDDCQFVALAECPDTGLLLKMKGDFKTPRWLYDLKTTSSGPDSFSMSASKFGYGVQAYLYLHIMELLGIDYEGRFRWVCCCKRKDWGYPCWIQDVTEEQLASGQRTARMLLNLYARYGAKQ